MLIVQRAQSPFKQTTMCILPRPRGGTLWIPPPGHAGALRTDALTRIARRIKNIFTINRWEPLRLPGFSIAFPSSGHPNCFADYLFGLKLAPGAWHAVLDSVALHMPDARPQRRRGECCCERARPDGGPALSPPPPGRITHANHAGSGAKQKAR
ncbi:hypothetical protein B0H17DRAFT_1199619 [Mycena rosella]|uniref:Uncharacterized protein n=1 Tax=Mycena rosella TaxID=1033263 RepID=A0AAD7DMT9_MYCRO|nr:hypothetical protein B0H17DRAFT_1199619 [Mycena rosella]